MSPLMQRLSWATLVAVLACGSVGCATTQTDAQRQADRDITDRVQAALNADKGLYAQHISVNANSGIVHLSGYVWTQPDLEEAQRIAGLVPGVTKVVNDMELERGGIDNSNVSR
ncbi:MAG TPA: BON domain-containing protein [Steroidobacteraceae bacterium]|nr:BON domain-containing protein [Steroidobacteraceae bacterium]